MQYRTKDEEWLEEYGLNIRITNVILNNFRNIERGEIVFNCGRNSGAQNFEADILGIYGQNGSGKSAFIEALAILKYVMTGDTVPCRYADCVMVGKPFAELTFMFTLTSKSGIVRTVKYSFCLKKQNGIESRMIEMQNRKLELAEDQMDPASRFLDVLLRPISDTEDKVVIFNEKFFLNWEESKKLQLLIDTSVEKAPFGPATKLKEATGNDKEALVSLQVSKKQAKNESRSFVFMNETMFVFRDKIFDSPFYQAIEQLWLFAHFSLHVVSAELNTLINRNIIVIRAGIREIVFDLDKPTTYTKKELSWVRGIIKSISQVLSQLVPELSLRLKTISKTETEGGEEAEMVMLMAIRNGTELPLGYESEGIKKIVSILYLIIEVFNHSSMTVAVDEFDAGVYEYLLGEILQAMEEYGKGQFIFTSHNLRPLEVISNKFLYFTTTNPKNRYIRLKYIAETNNLRDTYFREIIMGEQQEEIYKRTKTFKIIDAIKKAER